MGLDLEGRLMYLQYLQVDDCVAMISTRAKARLVTGMCRVYIFQLHGCSSSPYCMPSIQAFILVATSPAS